MLKIYQVLLKKSWAFPVPIFFKKNIIARIRRKPGAEVKYALSLP